MHEMKTRPAKPLRPAPSRSPRRDAKVSRKRIVHAATREFARWGYDGARMDAIAARARVSKTLLYHYFDSKEGLFIAVMEEIYQVMRQHHQELLLQKLEPAAAIEHLIRSVHRLFVVRQDILTLLNSENLYKASHIRKSKVIPTLYDPLLDALVDIHRRGAAAGSFRRDVDPVDLYISISGLSYFYIANNHTLGFIFHQNLLDPERLAAREQHIVDLIIGYLTSGR
jgi:TetR/AcrR family transcriptional regulator